MTTTRRALPWTLTRRLTDCLFPQYIPGKHHNLDSALAALMALREVRP